MASNDKRHAKNTADYSSALKKIVLIGTYSGNQLDEWPGFYTYPMRTDSIAESEGKRINELWIFSGAKEQRSFRTKFLGLKTKEELVNGFGCPRKTSCEALSSFQNHGNPQSKRWAMEKVLVRLVDGFQWLEKVAEFSRRLENGAGRFRARGGSVRNSKGDRDWIEGWENDIVKMS